MQNTIKISDFGAYYTGKSSVSYNSQPAYNSPIALDRKANYKGVPLYQRHNCILA